MPIFFPIFPFMEALTFHFWEPDGCGPKKKVPMFPFEEGNNAKTVDFLKGVPYHV